MEKYLKSNDTTDKFITVASATDLADVIFGSICYRFEPYILNSVSVYVMYLKISLRQEKLGPERQAIKRLYSKLYRTARNCLTAHLHCQM